MMNLEKARPTAARRLATMAGADQGDLALFGWDGRVVGTAGFLYAGIALHNLGRYGHRAASRPHFSRAANFTRDGITKYLSP